MTKFSIASDKLVDWSLSGTPLIFDLDDTIYSEREFLFRAYENISKEIYKNDWKEAHQFLCNTFNEEGRFRIFDKLLKKYPNDKATINICIEILRSSVFYNEIKPFEWFLKFLRAHEKTPKIRVITNGNPTQQRNKIKSLNFLNIKMDLELICANESEKKPSIESFYCLKDHRNIHSDIYVGDSAIDRVFCDNLGIRFLHTKGELTNFEL